ncbi:MAG: DUF3127 domain-containing protein [Candidatus Shikimatogenerans bostrichidophilus]|nr:MAG: DUF3127 domain-containing protein [Candidatus Shikimatogenerans bostrichidophilus]
MYLIGRIKNILGIQEFKNNFRKQSLILITDEQYPQNILIDFLQDRIDLLNYIKRNDVVKIFINIKGREWINKDGTIKYFNSIQGWKIEKVQNEELSYIRINKNKNRYSNYDENDDDDLELNQINKNKFNDEHNNDNDNDEEFKDDEDNEDDDEDIDDEDTDDEDTDDEDDYDEDDDDDDNEDEDNDDEDIDDENTDDEDDYDEDDDGKNNGKKK